MKAIDLIEKIEQEVQEVKKQGQEFINTDNLIQYLMDLKNQENTGYSDKEIDVRLAYDLANHNTQAQFGVEMLRSVTSSGSEALKSAILINGGAAVAILAFIGSIWAKDIDQNTVISLSDTLLFFTKGSLFAVIGVGFSYLTQYSYHMKYEKTAMLFHVITLLLVIASYVLFYEGANCGSSAFLNHFN